MSPPVDPEDVRQRYAPTINTSICGSGCAGCPSSKQWPVSSWEKCSADPRVISKKKFFYSPYLLDLPGFASLEDRDLWLRESTQVAELLKQHNGCASHFSTRPIPVQCKDGVPPLNATHGRSFVIHKPADLHGELLVLRDAVVQINSLPNRWGKLGCYQLSPNYEEALFAPPDPYGAKQKQIEKGYILITPEAATFQHSHEMMLVLMNFIDVLQADPSITVITNSGDIPLDQFGLSQRLVHTHSLPIAAKTLYYGCTTPANHPWPWLRFQIEAKVPLNKPQKDRHKFIFLERENTDRKYREVDTLIQGITDWLRHWNRRQVARDSHYKEIELVRWKGNLTWGPREFKELYKDAKVVMGVHGGGLYGAIYAPRDTLVIEIQPFVLAPDHSGDLIGSFPALFYRMFRCLGHRYYAIPVMAEGFVERTVPVTHELTNKVLTILEREFV